MSLNLQTLTTFCLQLTSYLSALLMIIPLKHYLNQYYQALIKAAFIVVLIYIYFASYLTLSFKMTYYIYVGILVPAFLFLIIYLTKIDFKVIVFLFIFISSIIQYPLSIVKIIDFRLFAVNSNDVSLELESLIILKVIYLIIFVFYCTKCYQPLVKIIKSYHNERFWRLVWIIPTLFYIFNLYLNPTTSRLNNQQLYSLIRDTLVFSLFIYIIILYLLYRFVFHQLQLKNYKKQTALYNLTQSNEYLLLKQYEQARQMRHDVKHHIMTIHALLDQENYQAIKDYLKRYFQTTTSNYKLFTRNLAINGLLNQYYALARQYHIPLDYNIYCPAKSSSNDVDVCTMIGNLLDNAITASLSLADPKQRYIKLDLSYDTLLTLRIFNHHCRPVIYQHHQYISHKTNVPGHGLASVQSLVAYYHGQCFINYTDNDFEVKIIVDVSHKE